MKKMLYLLLIILIGFSCKTEKDKKPVIKNHGTIIEYQALGNSFADINFVIKKDNTFKITVKLLSYNKTIIFDGVWKDAKNKFLLSFRQKLNNTDLVNLFDIEQNKKNNVIVEIKNYNEVYIPKNVETIWFDNVLCKKK